jgi:phospholipid/cholesterol/gamma-HCH transport system ATP-binding protein
VIYINNIHKSFGAKNILSGLTLEVKKGETMVIIGPSGCGKSVLLKHIMGLIKPDKGEIYIDNRDITRLSTRDLNEFRLRIGMLFQGGALFDSMTVGENIGFPLTEHTELSKNELEQLISEKLEMVGMYGIEHLGVAEISGGMAKRVALARSIIMEPQVILYDEPTTGLDPVMVTVIDKIITRLKKELQVTSLVVTHDMDSAFRIADRIAVHFSGGIIEVGTPEEIKNSRHPVVSQFISAGTVGPLSAGVYYES